MEWVETTGRTVEDAKEAALDQLGVDHHDAEFEVVEEPKTGLFGRTRGEARVRARVTPRPQRPKQERRRTKAGSKDGSKEITGPSSSAKAAASPQPGDSYDSPAETDEPVSKPKAPRAKRQAAKPATAPRPAPAEEGNPMDDSVTVEDQAELMEEFLEGLLEVFGVDGEISWEKIDDDTVEVEVVGDDLGLLIGPKGQTLQAVQDMARTVVQRRATGRHEGRIRLDIGGYRQRRREALGRFATQVADQVRDSGTAKALEPMNAADRKVVHDTINEIDGVSTRSDGQDPDRWVVILPAEG